MQEFRRLNNEIVFIHSFDILIKPIKGMPKWMANSKNVDNVKTININTTNILYFLYV